MNGSVCERCGAAFHCGAAAVSAEAGGSSSDGHASCWCMSLPKIALPESLKTSRCLCPECLKSFADYVTSFHSQDLSFRVMVVNATNAVREITELQAADPVATIALGRSIVGAALLTGQAKDGQAVGVVFEGDGPLGTVFAEATFEGHLRGYCSSSSLERANLEQQRAIKEGNVGVAIGRGLLRVVRSQPFQKEAQVGTVEIQTGEVGDDIAYYLQQSFQIPSVLSLGVQLNREGKVVAAGGVLVELLPDASEFTIRMLERNVQTAPPVSKLVAEHKTAMEIVSSLTGHTTMIGDLAPRMLAFKCICSLGRVERSVMLLGKEVLNEMIGEQKALETQCEFCRSKYNIPHATLVRLRDEL